MRLTSHYVLQWSSKSTAKLLLGPNCTPATHISPDVVHVLLEAGLDYLWTRGSLVHGTNNPPQSVCVSVVVHHKGVKKRLLYDLFHCRGPGVVAELDGGPQWTQRGVCEVLPLSLDPVHQSLHVLAKDGQAVAVAGAQTLEVFLFLLQVTSPCLHLPPVEGREGGEGGGREGEGERRGKEGEGGEEEGERVGREREREGEGERGGKEREREGRGRGGREREGRGVCG